MMAVPRITQDTPIVCRRRIGERGTDAELTVMIGADGGEYPQSSLNHTIPYSKLVHGDFLYTSVFKANCF